MNSSWWWLVIWAFFAGGFVFFPLGYWWRKRGDADRKLEWKASEIRKKKAMLQRNGRRLPRREGAGAPIVRRKATFRRG
jgi:hypothetical protein